jgi:hypothetical protein
MPHIHAAEGSVQLLLVFDEAHVLTAIPKSTSAGITRSKFHALGHVLKWIRHFPIFSIFMSTNTQVQEMAPAEDKHPSNRGGTVPRLLPPLTEFAPMDIHADGLLHALEKARKFDISSLSAPDVVTRMGRPV